MVSIVIPTLNEEKHIRILLDSLAEQDIQEEVEIVVADTGSTDRTREVVAEYDKNFHKVSVIPVGKPLRGLPQASGRNKGARASSGNPIFFIDADLRFPSPNFLREMTNHFRSRNLSIAPATLRADSRKKIDHIITGSYNILLRPAQYVRPLGAMCVVASREVFEKTGGYPEDVMMAEDHDFVKKCAAHGKYGILPFPMVYSVRRMEKEGRWGLLKKYLKASAYNALKGPIRRNIFKYEFKYDNDDKKTNLS